MVSVKYQSSYHAGNFLYPILNFIKIASCLSVFFLPQYSVVRAETELSRPEDCPAELDGKFLSPDGKCPFSGLVPVKGSCTEYIPCVSFNGKMLRPLRRAECPQDAGLGFDIEVLRCRTIPDMDNCLQKRCYPKKERIKQRQPTSSTNSTPADTLMFTNHTNESSNCNGTNYFVVSSSTKQPSSFLTFAIIHALAIFACNFAYLPF